MGDFHVETFEFSCLEKFRQDSTKICFTMAGTVDDRRMAQDIVRCDTIGVARRYQVACSYWLEDCIHLLWQDLTEKDKKHFSDDTHFTDGLEYGWPHICKKGQPFLYYIWRKTGHWLTSFNQWGFEFSVRKGNEAAARYFDQKLSLEEKEASLILPALRAGSKVFSWESNRRGYSKVLLYEMSLMTPEQQIEIIKTIPDSVIRCFLDWPQRDLFSKNARLLCLYLPTSCYDLLLGDVRSRAVHWENYCPTFFFEFFKHISPRFKKHFVNDDAHAIRFLIEFFNSGDAESIKTLFRNVDTADRVKLLFRTNILQLFYHRMSLGEWHLVDLCLREASLPEEERKRLGEIFRGYVNNDRFVAGRYPFVDFQSRKMDPEIPPLKLFFQFLNSGMSAEKEKKGQKRKLKDCSL